MAVAAVVALWMYDPAQTSWAPKCAIRLLTGWQCPGCGISRAMHALLHGRFYEALAYNWFFIVSIPYLLSVLAVLYMPALYANTRLRHAVTGPKVAWTYVVLFCLWFVIRNILGI